MAIRAFLAPRLPTPGGAPRTALRRPPRRRHLRPQGLHRGTPRRGPGLPLPSRPADLHVARRPTPPTRPSTATIALPDLALGRLPRRKPGRGPGPRGQAPRLRRRAATGPRRRRPSSWRDNADAAGAVRGRRRRPGRRRSSRAGRGPEDLPPRARGPAGRHPAKSGRLRSAAPSLLSLRRPRRHRRCGPPRRTSATTTDVADPGRPRRRQPAPPHPQLPERVLPLPAPELPGRSAREGGREGRHRGLLSERR